MRRTASFNSFQLAVLAAVSMLPAAPTVAATLFNGGVTYTYDDNVPNGKLSRDVKGDHFLTLDLSGGRYFHLSSSLGLIVTADLQATRYNVYSQLNNVTLGLSSSLRKKFGLGPMAPVVTVSAAVSHLDSRHDPRDRWIYKAGLGFRKRVSNRLELGIDYDFTKTEADTVEDIPFLMQQFGIGGDVYDHETERVTASLIFSVTERLSAYGAYARQEGTVLSSTMRNREIFLISDGIAPDPVFGDEVFAYSLEADADIFNVGLSWALGRQTSVNVGYERRETEGALDFTYDNNITHASILYAF